jgi:tetratricopeptide (TPR) repeat protein
MKIQHLIFSSLGGLFFSGLLACASGPSGPVTVEVIKLTEVTAPPVKAPAEDEAASQPATSGTKSKRRAPHQEADEVVEQKTAPQDEPSADDDSVEEIPRRAAPAEPIYVQVFIEDVSLLDLITRATPPPRRAALTIAEQGRQKLVSRNFQPAGSYLEKSLSIDPRNGYAFYYLALLRYLEGDSAQSLVLLKQAGLYLRSALFWQARVFSLQGLNYEQLRDLEKAQAAFEAALDTDEENIEAKKGLKRICKETRCD